MFVASNLVLFSGGGGGGGGEVVHSKRTPGLYELND